jgi:hypothetical protein
MPTGYGCGDGNGSVMVMVMVMVVLDRKKEKSSAGEEQKIFTNSELRENTGARTITTTNNKHRTAQ